MKVVLIGLLALIGAFALLAILASAAPIASDMVPAASLRFQRRKTILGDFNINSAL